MVAWSFSIIWAQVPDSLTEKLHQLDSVGIVYEKIYLNKDQVPTTFAGAYFIRILIQENDSLQQLNDYYREGTLYQRGYLKTDYDHYTVSPDHRSFDQRGNPIPSSVKSKQHTKDGLFTAYYRNSNRKFSGNFIDNKRAGLFEEWYFNGNKKGDLYYDDSLHIDYDFKIVNYYDSLGNQWVSDGDGKYVDSVGSTISQGEIKNGVKQGEWKGSFNKGKSQFSEQYEAGKLIEGISTDSTGREYRYDKVNVSPEYQDNGMQGFYQFVGTHLKYPADARRKGIEGRVYVQFIVDKKGKTENVTVVRGIHPGCDEYARSAREKADQFIPGKYRGQLTDVRMVVPITFRFKD
jgi:TonB family protein